VKSADTLNALEIVTTHVPVPEHPPPVQPLKVVPGVVEAVSAMAFPKLNNSSQSAPQFIPNGELTTVPLAAPVPVLIMES
jgi:hypothetical protein